MSSEIERLINELLNEEQNVHGVAVINTSGALITQTENWDISNDLSLINELLKTKLALGEKGISNIIIQGIKFMIVENTEERKIGTNITGKGHVIIAPVPIGGTGALVCYINPQASPRDALFTVQEFAKKLTNLI
jgi:predicted regulator of Ras-like GTPase activity (Roadblock/LC7/MglB family)